VFRYDKHDWLIILLGSAAAIYNNERYIRYQHRRDEEARDLAERQYRLNLRVIENQEHPAWARKGQESADETADRS
jgi:hypothetical protein